MTLVKLVVDYLPEGSAVVYEKLMGLLEEVLCLLYHHFSLWLMLVFQGSGLYDTHYKNLYIKEVTSFLFCLFVMHSHERLFRNDVYSDFFITALFINTYG